MRYLLALLFVLPAICVGGTLTVNFDAPTQFEDNTPIDRPVTYVLYAALEGQPLVELTRSAAPQFVVSLAPGRYCGEVYAVVDNVWSAPAPRPPFCQTIPAAEQPRRKTKPVTNVTTVVAP